MRLLWTLVLFAVFGIPGSGSGAQVSDSSRAYRAARDAEADYEYAARHRAPLSGSPRSTGGCDEIVGRFCIYYDTGRDTLPAEPPVIGERRREAIAKLRAALVYNPVRTRTVFPLVRLLLEDRQPEAALEVADRYREVASDVATGWMLLALTRHAAARIPEAELATTNWLAAADSGTRHRVSDASPLLHARERRRYRALGPGARAAYDSLFWRYADALYLTPGNEVWTEHAARHAEIALLEDVPTVRGSMGWSNDVAELTIRFGSPRGRSRAWPGSFGSSDPDIIEHWDPEQVIYAPPALDSVLALEHRAGMRWPMDTIRAISGHAPPTFRRMLPLQHQAVFFRAAEGGDHIRIAGFVPAESNARGAVAAGLFLLDDSLRILARAPASTAMRGDTIFFAASAELPPRTAFYSAEVLESGSRLAARARFRARQGSADAGLYLSDIAVAEPLPAGRLPTGWDDPEFRLKPEAAVRRGASIGIMAVIHPPAAPDSVTVELEFRSLAGGAAAIRAARWLGERLGLGAARASNRLSWVMEIRDAAPTPVALTLETVGLDPGRYVIEMRVTTGGGLTARARRELIIEK